MLTNLEALFDSTLELNPRDRLRRTQAAHLGELTEKNINNKIARGGFTAAFLIQALEAIEAKSVRLDD